MKSIASFALLAASMALTSACATANSQEVAGTSEDGASKGAEHRSFTMKVANSDGNRHVVRVSSAVEEVMKDKDTDDDGKISKKEYYTGPNQGRFDAIDTDDNEYIDEAELKKTFEERFGNMAGRFAGNKWLHARQMGEDGDLVIDMDGMDEEIEITIREAHEKAEQAMAKVELQMGHLRERMGDENFMFVAPHLEGFELDEEEMEAMREKRRAQMLKRLDSDGNGAVSRDEFANRTNKKFDRLDKDEDGTLSGEELEGHMGFGGFELPHLADGASTWVFRSGDDDEDEKDSDEK